MNIFFRLTHRLLLVALACWLFTAASFGATTVIPWGWDTALQTAVPAGLTNLVAIAAGDQSGMGLRSDGTVAFWGANTWGYSTPPAGLSNVVAIDAGADLSIALKSDGRVVAWGWNSYYQTNVPADLSNVVAVAAGSFHCLALKQDGTVVGWGLNDSGQTNVPAGLSNVVAVSAGYKHSLALKKDGTVAAWGSNYDYQGGYEGQATVPAGISNVVAISAGGFHNLLLKADGTVMAWGHNYGPMVNYSGQSVVPPGLSNVVAVSAGGYHSLALKDDGTIVEWGDNAYGEMNMPAGVSNIVAIAAGEFYSLALCYTSGPPLILRQPMGRATCVGVPADLSIRAVGPEPLTYQWQFEGANLPGATNPSLTWSNPQATDSGTYSVVVSNPYGSITSSNIQLTVTPSSPIILVQPGDQSVLTGSNVLLSVSAAGTAAMQYQWRHNGDNLLGATDALLLLPNAQPLQTGLYDVLVSNTLGCITSRQATLLVYTPPTINVQPSNRTAIVGTPTTFAVSAQSLPPVSFQWQLNGTNIPGATNAVLAFSAAQFSDAGFYRVIISNPLSSTISEAAVLTVVDGPPVIVVGPVTQDSYLGGPAAFQVVAGGTPPLQYQWRFNGIDLPGATNSILAFAQVTTNQVGLYSVVISNALGTTTSMEAELLIGPVLAWGDNSSGQTNLPPGLTNTIAFSAGSDHNLALKSDGTVVAWGNHDNGRCDVPSGLSNVMAIAAGNGFSLALKRDGSLVGWGSVPAPMPEGLTNIVQIAAGSWHALALKADGTVMGWGSNDHGQASPPSGLTNVIAIAAGVYHSIALKADGTIVAWGSNYSGETGVPKDLTNIIAIAAGLYDTLALRADGTVAAWGYNIYGETPAPKGLSNVMAIAAGYYHCLALKDDGTVVGWGFNDQNLSVAPPGLNNVIAIGAGWFHSLALCNQGSPVLLRQPASQTNYSGTTASFRAIAVGPGPMTYQWHLNGSPIEGATNASLTVTNVQLIDAGSYSVAVANPLGTTVTSNATLNVIFSPPLLTAQPLNQVGFLGPNTSNITFRVTVLGSWPLSYQWQFNGTNLPGATASSLTVTNAQLANGGLYCVVVSNAYGLTTSMNAQLSLVPVVGWGQNTYRQASAPTTAVDVVKIAAGILHSLALRADGTVLGWGGNSSGQTTIPTAATNVVAIAAGFGHSLALRADGTTLGWGDNSNGQAAVPTAATNGVAIAAGANHSLVLRPDGTVLAWGFNNYGQTTVPSSATNVVAIAGGAAHSLALRADGTVAAWGNNNYSQIIVPSAATNVVAIAAGGNHNLALRADGKVVAWGNNNSGQTTVPSAATNVVAIAAGSDHSLALRADGSVLTWGNSSGGLGSIPVGVTNGIGVAGGQYYSLALLADGSPHILSQPWSRTVKLGIAMVLSAPAVGMFPLSYQWQCNGTNIPGATAASYEVNNVAPSTSGRYALIVSNSLGTVTSAAANVNLAPAASNTTAVTLQNRSIIIPAQKLLLSAGDPDGDVLKLSSVSATSTNGGKVTLNAEAVTYTPATNYAGADRFTYYVADGRGGIASAYVLVQVYRANQVSGSMLAPKVTAGGCQVSFGGIAGLTYTLQRAESVSGPWVTLDSITIGADGMGTWTDTNAPSASAYYRTLYP